MISPRILWGVVSLAGACLLSGCATSPAEKPRPQDDASSSTPDIRAAAELPEYPLVQADDVLFWDDALPADAAIFFVLEDRSFLAVGGEEHPIELRGPKSEGEGRGSWAYYHRNKKALSEAYKSLGLDTGSPDKAEDVKTLYFWFTRGPATRIWNWSSGPRSTPASGFAFLARRVAARLAFCVSSVCGNQVLRTSLGVVSCDSTRMATRFASCIRRTSSRPPCRSIQIREKIREK